jgi:Ca2+/Na+ antiporter
LSIESNYGHPHFTELKEFEAWGLFEFEIFQIISNLVWILGVALILAAFSYHEFFAHLQKTKKIEVFKRASFKKPFLLGLILVASGVSASTKQLWLTAIFGVVAILLAIVFVKSLKTQVAEAKESKN